MQKTKGQNLLRGASVLAASMIAVKLIGAVFKIPLGNILDGSAMGYFNTAYNVFTMVYAFSTAGLPTAIAKMVAEQSAKGRYKDIRRIHDLSVKLFFFMGLIGTILMAAFSKLYVDLAGNSGALLSVLAIAPAIFFGCMMSAYRGYYEGLRNMTPTAVSQIVEVIAKLICGLALSVTVVSYGKSCFTAGKAVFGTVCANEAEMTAAVAPYAAAAAIFGVTLSTMVGTVYMLIKWKRQGDRITPDDLKYSPKPMRGQVLLTRLIKIAIPVSLGSIVMNVAQAVDTVTIINCLDFAFAQFPEKMRELFSATVPAQVLAAGEAANFIFGSYSGYALSVFNLVPAFTSIFGKSALPNVTACWSAGDKQGAKVNIESVVRMTSMIAAPASFGIFFMAGPILTLLYPSKVAEVTIASSVLSWQGLSLIFLGLTTPLFAVLQGLGKVSAPPKYMVVGMVIKLILNLVFISIPAVNINGAALGTGACYLVILLLAMNGIRKTTGIRFSFLRLLAKPLFCGFVCGGSAWCVNWILTGVLPRSLTTLVSIAFAGVVYVAALLVTRALSKDDVIMLPKGEKFAKVLEKYHCLG
ncbi:MAG: polysaccharide biosynthesis protein [Oscillospiraceae bacterium]|nr:polysaccharide biosynthesis protein [Oscillospiraceae bacterium]